MIEERIFLNYMNRDLLDLQDHIDMKELKVTASIRMHSIAFLGIY